MTKRIGRPKKGQEAEDQRRHFLIFLMRKRLEDPGIEDKDLVLDAFVQGWNDARDMMPDDVLDKAIGDAKALLAKIQGD